MNKIVSEKKLHILIIFLIITLFLLFYFIFNKLNKNDEHIIQTEPNLPEEISNEEEQQPNLLPDIPKGYSSEPNELSFFKKTHLDYETQKCYYRLSNFEGHQEDDFKMNMEDIQKILKEKAITLYIKNQDLKPNSSINLLIDPKDSGQEKNLYEFRNKPNLRLRISRKKNFIGDETSLLVTLLSFGKNIEFLCSNTYLNKNYPKINLITTNLTLYRKS
ncbi:hypothetical protein [Candidatus Phytoplasma fraxini]|uniref:Effector n=1 Tax=Ash yellows phytoplasma TaxID=35780 RepID=A0ABZ2U873_ASHYP